MVLLNSIPVFIGLKFIGKKFYDKFCLLVIVLSRSAYGYYSQSADHL